MKVFLSVDMEGITDVVAEPETDPEHGGEAYRANCHRMTQETNAAIEGAVQAGADEILVADSHWNFNNLIPEELHEAATLLRGTPRPFSMVQDLDASFGAVLCVGYHAMAGTPNAIIDHTYTGRIRAVQVNGRVIGETGITGYLAGHFGVPVVLVTGDGAVCAEARGLIKGVHTVAVKEAVTSYSAKNLHPKTAQALIRGESEKAVREADKIERLAASRPVALAVEFKNTEDADRAVLVPGVTRIGGTRIEVTAPDFREAFRFFEAMASILG